MASYLLNERAILWNLKKAFVTALEKGQPAFAERIYEVYPQQMRGRNFFVELARSGLLGAVTYIYTKGYNEPGFIGRACASAARRAHIDVVKFLISSNRVSSEAFDMAFKRACSGCNTIDVAMFLYNLKRFSARY